MIDLLLREKIVAIVRGIPAEAALPTAEALYRGGIRLMEVTMNTGGALDIIESWRNRYEDRLAIGAGTVLDVKMAKQAVEAGAQFLISPNLDEEVVSFGNDHEIEVWPGVTTATEIVRAWKAGASAVKPFPLGALGPRYLKEMRGPLSHIPMIAVGGMELETIPAFLEAGAVAVGVGGSLTNPQLIREGRFEELAELAHRYVMAVQNPPNGNQNP